MGLWVMGRRSASRRPRIVFIMFLVIIALASAGILKAIFSGDRNDPPVFDPAYGKASQSGGITGSPSPSAETNIPQWISEEFIAVNGLGRDGSKLDEVNGVVIHYVANPGTTAKQNRSYFNQRDTRTSAHFIIGLDGEIIQCLPLTERSAASNDRNSDTISIELCHPDADGSFTDATYASLVKLTAWLCKEYSLKPYGDVIRHYDITGKLCPLFFVENEDAWESFLEEVNGFGGD